MGDNSAIEWTDATWNPVVGCTRVSEGCKNCYAYTLHDRRHKAYLNGAALPAQYAKPFREVQMMADRLDQPLRWKRSRRIFVNSLSDLFHQDVPDEFIDDVFLVIAQAPQHTFQLLTKRPQRMYEYLSNPETAARLEARYPSALKMLATSGLGLAAYKWQWPIPNVWLGVSVENQRAADERIPLLCQTPAAVRFLSCEPLLGSVNLQLDKYPVDWVIVGGESGGFASRPMQPDWATSIRDQCQSAGVAFFFKQWGDWGPSEHAPLSRIGKKKAGRRLDGVEWNQYPGGQAS